MPGNVMQRGLVMKQLTFICLPPPPPSFSSSASLNLNVSHYSVAMKTHLAAHLGTSDRCWQTSVYESVYMVLVCLSRVCICFHTVCMNHHIDWAEPPSVCRELDGARYLVIYARCLRAGGAQRDSCGTGSAITALGLFGVFPVVIPSKENSTFTCHFSFPKWARKQGRRGAPGPTR